MPKIDKLPFKPSSIKKLIADPKRRLKNHLEVAQAAKMDSSTLSIALRDEMITRVQLEKLMAAFDLSEDYFIGRDPKPKSAGQVDLSASVSPNWDDETLAEAIKSSKHGEELEFCSTYFPDQEMRKIAKAIRGLGRLLPKEEMPSKRLSLKILLLDSSCSSLMETRTLLYRHLPFSETVRSQADEFCRLKDELADKLNIRVKFHRAWPFGHYFRIGNRLLQYSPMLTTCPATDGITIVATDSQSEVWVQIMDSFTQIFDHKIHSSDVGSLPELK